MTAPRTTSWGYYQQGQEQWEEIEKFGSALSIKLDCSIHYPAFSKRIFECKCGVLFPIFIVQAAFDSDSWDVVLKRHIEEYRTGGLANI